jgi:tellurite resistance protein TerC
MTWIWVGMFAVILVGITFDLMWGRWHGPDRRLRSDLYLTTFWILLGLAFGFVVYWVYEDLGMTSQVAHDPVKSGWEAAIRYWTAYLLEESLSVDNLFVIASIFTSLGIDPVAQRRVLFWGILGAIVMRLLMVGGGLWLVGKFEWLFYVFGVILILGGLRMLGSGGGDEESNRLLDRLRRRLPVAWDVQDGGFLLRRDGRLWFTPLAVALVAVEISDVVFAVDSVPAVLAVTGEPFIGISSNLFAIIGLRSLYSVLAGAMQSFHYLGKSLALLLLFIGAKMMLHDVIHIPNLVSLSVVVLMVTIGVVASLPGRRASMAAAREVAARGEEERT